MGSMWLNHCVSSMKRTIAGYLQDAAEDWVAYLDCGHRQHVRHQPPFRERPWVTTLDGRAAHLGQSLDCAVCERFEWPTDFAAYKRTPEFTAATIPAGLRKDHSTKKGVWAKIVVLEGTLRYVVDPLNATFTLEPSTPGIVIPEVLHYIGPLGEVRFYVEFYRANANDNAAG